MLRITVESERHIYEKKYKKILCYKVLSMASDACKKCGQPYENRKRGREDIVREKFLGQMYGLMKNELTGDYEW